MESLPSILGTILTASSHNTRIEMRVRPYLHETRGLVRTRVTCDRPDADHVVGGARDKMLLVG